MAYRSQLEDVPDELIAAARAERTRRCTCAGPTLGYPQHESFCGQPDPDEDEDELALYEWQDTHDAPPED